MTEGSEYLVLDTVVATMRFPADERFGTYSGRDADVYFDPSKDEIGIVGPNKIILGGYAKQFVKKLLV